MKFREDLGFSSLDFMSFLEESKTHLTLNWRMSSVLRWVREKFASFSQKMKVRNAKEVG